MPFTAVFMRRGKSAAYRRAVLDGVYEAMRDVFDVPEGDQFMALTECDPENFVYNASYRGIERTDDLVVIQITANNTRTADQKKALYRRIVTRLSDDPGLRPADVYINLIEVAKENWSLGNGEAQFA